MRSAILFWALMILATVSCQSPTAPGELNTVDQFAQSLKSQGLAVSTESSASDMGFFAVPAQQLLADGQRVYVFQYSSSDRAAADAALVSPDGQPNPRALIDWISVPHFYRQQRLIVLYVGCSSQTLSALETSLGRAIVTGRGSCAT